MLQIPLLPIHVIFDDVSLDKLVKDEIKRLPELVASGSPTILSEQFVKWSLISAPSLKSAQSRLMNIQSDAGERPNIELAFQNVVYEYERLMRENQAITNPTIIILLGREPSEPTARTWDEWRTYFRTQWGTTIYAFWLHRAQFPTTVLLEDTKNILGQIAEAKYRVYENADKRVVYEIAARLKTEVQVQFQTVEWNKIGLAPRRKEESALSSTIPSRDASPKPQTWLTYDPPADWGDRKSHTESETLQGHGGWVMVAASRRGKLHEHEGTFREDDFLTSFMAGWFLIAVADGLGSGRLSRVGSRIAVQAAMEVMEQKVRSEVPTASLVESTLQKALKHAFRQLHEELKNEEAKKRERRPIDLSINDFGTTLLVMMFHPAKLLGGAAQVGDGLIVTQFEDGRIGLLRPQESEKYSGEIYSLTSFTKYTDLLDKPLVYDFSQLLKSGSITAPPYLFFVMSDGVADDFFPPLEQVADLVKPMSGVLSAESPENALVELIGYEKIGSYDDRTLVVLCQPDLISGVLRRPSTELVEMEEKSEVMSPSPSTPIPRPMHVAQRTIHDTGSIHSLFAAAKEDEENIGKHSSDQIFVSYSRLDWDQYVRPVVEHLREAKLDVWVDQHLLRGGDYWLDKINAALEESGYLVLCVSPDALSSKYVKMEYRSFFTEGKPIIPVICRPVRRLPAELQMIQYHPYDLATLSQLLQQMIAQRS